jgi:hypothetical protein
MTMLVNSVGYNTVRFFTYEAPGDIYERWRICCPAELLLACQEWLLVVQLLINFFFPLWLNSPLGA